MMKVYKISPLNKEVQMVHHCAYENCKHPIEYKIVARAKEGYDVLLLCENHYNIYTHRLGKKATLPAKYDLIFHEVIYAAKTELLEALEKHGKQENLTPTEQFLILGEEIGEIANALLEKDYPNARKEIAQSIAMLIKLWRYVEGVEMHDLFEQIIRRT